MVNPYTPWTKQWIIADKIGVEGNYSNNPDDRGGATKYGVIQRTADAYKADLVKLFKWTGDIKDFTIDMAFYVYDKEFWSKMRLDDILKRSPALADKMFDIGINVGWDTAGQWLQLILNVANMKGTLYPDLKIDGNIGNVTIAAYDALAKKRGVKATAWNILKLLICKQGAHYVDISFKREQNETFLWGWSGRIDHNLVGYYKALNGS